MLCEKCHEREATCHSTSVIEGVANSTELCEECLVSSAAPVAREFFAAAKTARCRYCGGLPCGGGMDSSEISTGGQQISFLCLRCRPILAAAVGARTAGSASAGADSSYAGVA